MLELKNYNNLKQFVKDNLKLFEVDNVPYTRDYLKKEFENQGKQLPSTFHSHHEIKKAINNFLSDFLEKNNADISRIYKQLRFDKANTYKQFKQSYDFVSQKRFIDNLEKIDKNVEIIFVNDEFTKEINHIQKIDTIDDFCKNNIVAFNASPSRFNKESLDKYIKNKYTSTGNENFDIFYKADIDRYLEKRFFELTKEQKDEIYKYFCLEKSIKKTQNEFYIKYILRKSDIAKYIKDRSFMQLGQSIFEDHEEEVLKGIIDVFKTVNVNIANIEDDLKKILNRFLPLILSNGFARNMTNVDSGIMVANAGDSAQFLFIARAILAGFDSSNVDVRSSRYDCIVEYKGKIFKVQVKGISDSTVHYKDRDRGGAGIDHTNKRNKGRRITKEDCDIYAAVDKKTGVVYLVPISYLENCQKDSEKIEKIKKYREHWNIFEELYDQEVKK